MVNSNLMLIFTIFMVVAQQIEAGCVCNEKGTNVCSCSGVVRPRPKRIKRPEFKLPPVGDKCRCSKTMIQPASLPKPCTKKPAPSCSCPGVPVSPTQIMPQVNYIVSDNSLPADPISVSLAAQAGKAIQVPEAKLAYGFNRKPVNALPKVYISSIKEENLYALANDVITLKKPVSSEMKIMEEDYPEPDEEEAETDDYQRPRLTYKQLGYEPEDFENPTFVPMPSMADVAEAGPTLMDDSCGFKPGRIAKMKHHKKIVNNNHFMQHF